MNQTLRHENLKKLVKEDAESRNVRSEQKMDHTPQIEVDVGK